MSVIMEYPYTATFTRLAAAMPSTLFFFQADDGIRYIGVSGVQTCALPICDRSADPLAKLDPQTRYSVEMLLDSARLAGLPYGPLESKALEGISKRASGRDILLAVRKIGRASCRERV